jgi:hypothetical protein
MKRNNVEQKKADSGNRWGNKDVDVNVTINIKNEL